MKKYGTGNKILREPEDDTRELTPEEKLALRKELTDEEAEATEDS